MRKLFNKYADVLTKPGKLVSRDIKDNIKFLNLSKPKIHHRLRIMSEREL